MRLVLIVGRKYNVYEGTKCIQEWVLDEGFSLLTAEEVEQIRVRNYDKA